MVQSSEVISLVLSVGVLLFIVQQRSNLTVIPEWRVLLSSYIVCLLGCALTVAEGFFLADAMNCLEHISYAVSAVLLAWWCWRVFFTNGDTSWTRS